MRPVPSDLPLRLRQFIALVAFAGLVTLGFALPSALAAPPSAGATLVVIGFFVVGDLALVHIRFGHNNYSFTWSELALVFGLVAVPSAWLVLAATLAVAVAQAVARRPAVKLLFNATSTATGVGLARLACLGFGVPEPGPVLDRPGTWVVLAAASLTHTIWNSVTVGMAVGFSQRLPVRDVLRKGALLQAIVWSGNTVVGLGVAAVAWQSAGLLVVLPLVLAALYYAYFAYLRLAEDRDSWQVLQDTSGELARLARAEIAAVVLRQAQRLFRAEDVELLLLEPGDDLRATVWTGTGGDPAVRRNVPLTDARTYWPRAYGEREMFEVHRAGAPPVLVLPLCAADECLGTLRIGFGGPVRFSRRERQVLRTFGNQVAVSVQNARLFEQTREERAKLRRVVDNTSDGILSVDAHGRTTSWNPAMARMTGLDVAAVVGAPFTLGRDACDDTGRTVGVSWLWDLLGQAGSAQAQVVVGRTRGDERWLALSVSGVRRDGAPETLVVVARDVTALRRAALAKEEFLATVSHELRTPLTSLNGWLLTLLRDDYQPAPDELRQVHETMLRSTNRLKRLVEDLLSVNALDGGSLAVEPVPLAVDDLVGKVVAEFAAEHPDRPVAHRRAGLAGLAIADGGRLEQVLGHLLSNADKYSQPGAPVEVSVARAGEMVELVVADRGCGIPAGQLDAVFERFHRLGDFMTRPQQQGTGVGLHLARHLVEAMRGTIWATSAVGRGSEFHVRLPAAPLLAVLPPPPEQRDAATEGGGSHEQAEYDGQRRTRLARPGLLDQVLQPYAGRRR